MPYRKHSFLHAGIEAGYVESGAGFPLLLLHGSGPGASTIGNWRLVLEPLAERFHVHAMDLIGFGQSGRKPEPPFFDIDLWIGQCRALIGRMPGDRIGILGHSLSAALALKLAAIEPRIAKVLTTGAMGAPFAVNEHTIRCWSFPPDRRALRRTLEGLIFDASLIDDAYLAARERVLHEDPGYAEYFSRMFAGDRQAYADAAVVGADELSRIGCAVTMLHGRNDLGFPPSVTLALADRIAQADVQLIGRCSHSIALEHPAKLLAAAWQLFG
jgi:2-hydroxymuconate-semialdehyde hydrolase